MAAYAQLARNIRPLSEYRNDAWKCVRCGICRMTNPEKLKSQRYADNCPSGTRFKFESYFASGRQEIVRALLSSPPEIEVTERLLHVVYTCTLCGNCQVNCNPIKDLEPTNEWIALREWLVKNGHAPLPAHMPLIRSIKDYDNPWQQPRSARDKWAKGLGVKDISKDKAEVLFFVGCTASYDPVAKEIASASMKIFTSAGVDVGILGKNERCCGSTVMRIGDRKGFTEVRTRLLDVLKGTGARTIVTACSGCYSTLSHEYSDGLKIEVLHLSQFLERLMGEGKVKFTKEVPSRVTYHDPCHLGRYTQIFDPPRKVLQSIPGVTFSEMERIRDYSWCCGAGGGVRAAFPEAAAWAATRRVEEAVDAGAKTIVSCCPFCEQNIRAAAQASADSMQVTDLAILMSQAL